MRKRTKKSTKRTRAVSVNVRDRDWNKLRIRAARLLAQGRLTDIQIASAIQITDRQLYRWKQNPIFAKAVTNLIGRMDQESQRFAIGRRHERLSQLQEQIQRLDQIIAERAADKKTAQGPGGKTGLIVHRVKNIGNGENATIVDEYEFDAALAKERRELLKQAAIEAGQWDQTTKVNVNVTNQLTQSVLADPAIADAACRLVESVYPSTPDPRRLGSPLQPGQDQDREAPQLPRSKAH